MTDVDPANRKQRVEEEWKAITLAVAFAGAAILGFVVWRYVFHAPDDLAETLSRSRIVAPFGVIYVAAVTFSATIWRTMITSRQADQQRDQLEKLQIQIDQTEESNLAALLQKGAEFLSNAKDNSKVSAGIASLEAVAESGNERLAVTALNLLADFIETNLPTQGQTSNLRTAILSLASISDRTERTSTRNIVLSPRGTVTIIDPATLDSSRRFSTEPEWLPISGVRTVTYRGGKFARNFDWERLNPLVSFDEVLFESCLNLAVDGNQHTNCTFSECSIASLRGNAAESNRFESCSFSGCRITEDNDITALSGFNYFRREQPPVLMAENGKILEQPDWAEMLRVIEA
ncbi:hypothetical protein [Oricola indica]|jgi:hypothetical protein|uniref:hypothetical protein n=1 Tax=Oricola indica TaxID=2872591 RepID=UPI001CBF91CF|nr:hypothetical protein [Oricola indica]